MSAATLADVFDATSARRDPRDSPSAEPRLVATRELRAWSRAPSPTRSPRVAGDARRSASA